MINNQLRAVRYSGDTYAGISITENLANLSDIRIRWSLPGGLQKAHIPVRAKSKYDAYDRYNNHLGQRIAIFDSFCDRYVGGNVFEIIPDGRDVIYVIAGPWKRAKDDFYETGDRPATGNTDALIKDILTDSMNIDSTDQTNIDASSVGGAGWFPMEQDGSVKRMFASDAIKQLAAIGDSSNNPMDFYFVDQPFDGVQMQNPLPYLKSRSSTASPDWQFSRADIVPGGAKMSRNIWNLKTSLVIAFNRVYGTATLPAGAELADTAATFLTDGVAPGDTVSNLTADTNYKVASVDSDTAISMTVTAGTLFSTGDRYSIKLQTARETGAGSATENFWAVAGMMKKPDITSTQAIQLRDQLLDIYKEPVQKQSFVLGSRQIRDGDGALWPLWRPLFGDSFYFRVTDLFPDAAVFGAALDQKQTFIAVAMDYTQKNNRLRVVPSTSDARLDAVLARAKITEGFMIDTGTTIDMRPRRRPRRGR